MKIAVIGGGIAGTTAAIQLKRAGHTIDLYEKGNELLSGGPWCHLHKGGFLYPMLSINECKILYNHSCDFIDFFKESGCIEDRPTIIAYKTNSAFSVNSLLHKCKEILPETEYIIHHRNTPPETKYIETFLDLLDDHDSIMYPFVSVNEPGINMNLAKDYLKRELKNIDTIFMNTIAKPLHVINHWNINGITYDYIIYATGHHNDLDDECIIEQKSSWLIYFKDINYFPEIAIIGERGTSEGMIQIAPTAERNIYHVHAMTLDSTIITPFSDLSFYDRACNAIKHISKYIRVFDTAEPYLPMFGIQRIPGKAIDYRTSDVRFISKSSASIEIVKGISSITAANKLVSKITNI